MAEEKVIELDVGCHPEAAISGGMLLQSEDMAFFTFNAMSNKTDAGGKYFPVGTAIMEFDMLHCTRFGSPNDEGQPEHPLYEKGLKDIGYAVCEVVNSQWATEAAQRSEASARRIWRTNYQRFYGEYSWALRHIFIVLDDSTFECLSKGFSLTLSEEPYDLILGRITKKLLRSE